MHNIEELRTLLSGGKKIVILPHQRPDADALGSCLAIASYLQKKGNFPTVISPTVYPDFLKWMQGNEKVVIYDQQRTHTLVESLFEEADIVFCLDFSELHRTAPLHLFLEKSKAKIVLLDHHIGKKDFAHFELWTTQAAATAELVYDFIHLLGDEHLIDIPMAQCIYAGIMTDTGSFRHPSTTSKVHKIAAHLIELGLDSNLIHRLVYDNSTESRLRFLGYCLQSKLVIIREHKTAYFAITAQELRDFGTRTGDTEGLVNYALSIEGIYVAGCFIDHGDEIRISLRSAGNFSVAEMASSYFNGGGHKNAAGGRSSTSLEETINLFRNILPNYHEKLMQLI